MKSNVFHLTKFKAIVKVLQNHPNVFENKPQALAAVTGLSETAEELQRLLTDLTVPVKSVYVNRRIARKAMIDEFGAILYMTKLLAIKADDQELLITIKAYLKRFRSVSVNQLLLMIAKIQQALSGMMDLALEYGLTGERVETLNQKVLSYQNHHNHVNDKLGNRLSERKQIIDLIKFGNSQLYNGLDQFVRFHKDEFPEFGFAYNRVRYSRKRRSASPDLPQNSDISGMVTIVGTDEPIAAATVILMQYNEIITTGTDGYFLFSELHQGKFILSCHASGFQVAEPVELELHVNDSLIHNFSLTPVTL